MPKTMRLADDEIDGAVSVDRGKAGKVQLRGMDPREQFYLALSVGNSDGSIEDLNGEPCEAASTSEREVIDAAEAVNEAYPGLVVYVYKCVPVAKVWRGKTRVTKLLK